MIEIRAEEAPVRGWTWWRIYVDGVRQLGHWDTEAEAEKARADIELKMAIAS